jgi:hypothetical protein
MRSLNEQHFVPLNACFHAATLEALAKRTRQEALRAYLAEQVRRTVTSRLQHSQIDSSTGSMHQQGVRGWHDYQLQNLVVRSYCCHCAGSG